MAEDTDQPLHPEEPQLAAALAGFSPRFRQRVVHGNSGTAAFLTSRFQHRTTRTQPAGAQRVGGRAGSS